MKLYTEEQLLNTVKAVLEYDNEVRIEKHLKALEPIELPSDEEIKEYFSWGYGGDSGSAIYGAKWMRDKILNK